jgi:ASC-1-like (ASCH) protein
VLSLHFLQIHKEEMEACASSSVDLIVKPFLFLLDKDKDRKWGILAIIEYLGMPLSIVCKWDPA